MAQADPASFDFGTAIVTRVTAQGTRSFARLMGIPGRNKHLLNMRVADDSVLLLGRVKTGDQSGSWDGWILSSQAGTGQVRYERNVDVQNGDMFWDAAPLNDGRLLAVGSTNYTQNPSGLSVSDVRDSLALVVIKRMYPQMASLRERRRLTSGVARTRVKGLPELPKLTRSQTDRTRHPATAPRMWRSARK